eukprot:15433987-Alexandrium_andersonii.AAC.1
MKGKAEHQAARFLVASWVAWQRFLRRRTMVTVQSLLSSGLSPQEEPKESAIWFMALPMSSFLNAKLGCSSKSFWRRLPCAKMRSLKMGTLDTRSDSSYLMKAARSLSAKGWSAATMGSTGPL